MSQENISEEDEALYLLEKILTLKKSVEQLTKQKNTQIRTLEHDVETITRTYNKNMETFYTREKQNRNSFQNLHQKFVESQQKNQQQEREIEQLKQQLEIKNPDVLQQKVVSDQKNEITRLKNELSEQKKIITQKEETIRLAKAKLELSDKHINRLKKEYFFSLNMGLKFNFMVKGYECNISPTTLWEACQQEKVDYTRWKIWIEEKMQAVAKKGSFQNPKEKKEEKPQQQ